jgi:ATP/maltotriose-dependent transcriptional regulator MalT
LFESNNYDLARDYFEQSIAIYRDLNDRWGIAYGLQWMSIVYELAADINDFEGNMRQASPYAEESLAIFQQMGSQWGIAALGIHLGIHAVSLSEYSNSSSEFAKGKRLAEESLRLYQEIGIQWGVAVSYWVLSWAAMFSGELSEARQLAYEGLTIVLKYRLWRHAYFLLSVVAEIYLRRGETAHTYEVLAIMDQQRRKLGQAKDNWSFAAKIDLDGEMPPNLRAAVTRGRTRDFETALREVVDNLSKAFSDVGQSVMLSHPDLLDALSERELEILRLVAGGMSNQQIADEMVIALGTVKTHVHNIYGKLGVESRTQAIARARDLSLI